MSRSAFQSVRHLTTVLHSNEEKVQFEQGKDLGESSGRARQGIPLPG